MEYTVFHLQVDLNFLGFDCGTPDGVRGRKTIAAVKAFQKSRRLEPDGLVGPITQRAIAVAIMRKDGNHKETKFIEKLSTQQSLDTTPWMDQANRVRGMHERKDNKRLWDFLKSDGKSVGDPALHPWCGDFVQTCLALSMPDEVLPNNPYAAISWQPFGVYTKPCYGAVLSFHRGDPTKWQGHVGFYVAENELHYMVLSGNQTDAVNVAAIPKDWLRNNGSRWPATALPASGEPTFTTEPAKVLNAQEVV